MNYEAFGNQLISGDYARSNLFEVTISPSRKMDGPGVIPETMSFMIKTAALPGKQLGEVQVKRFGAQFKMANDMIVDTLPMTIICSKDMRERRFITAWIEGIHGSDTGHYKDPYRMAYYDDYTTTVTITSIDRQGNDVYAVQLHEAWPNNMGQVDLSWENSEISTFTVTLAFRDWEESWVGGASANSIDDNMAMERPPDDLYKFPK
jgi:hypothetical protein